MRECPVIVPAALIFPFLDGFACGALAGEVLDRLLNGFAIGFRDFDEDAVHVKDEEVFQHHHKRLNSSRTLWVCCRVPTGIRTPPGISWLRSRTRRALPRRASRTSSYGAARGRRTKLDELGV